MSEFRKATKEAESIFSEIEKLADITERSTSNEIKSQLMDLEEKALKAKSMGETQLKFASKLNEKDPVSGELRFGPQMQSKIVAFGDSVEALTSKLNEKLDYVSNMNEIVLKKENDIAIAQKEAEEDLLIQLQLQNNQSDEAKLLADENEKEMKLKENEELARQAANVREKRKLELELERVNTQNQINEIVRIKDSYNQMSSGETALMKSLQLLKSVQNERQTGLNTLLDILENINAHPDDEKFRRLKISSPLLEENLLKYDGGIESLMACGFYAITESKTPAPSTATIDDDNENPTSKSDIPHIILTMTEPNPEIDMQKWINWFDNLRICRDSVQKIKDEKR